MWPEVEKVKSENRHELVLGGAEINQRLLDLGGSLQKSGIFLQTGLNFLDLHDTSLAAVPDEIAHLAQLQSLVLNGNQIADFSVAITKLGKLKHLDLSANRIERVPAELAALAGLETLNLSGNRLEAFPPVSNAKLAVLDLSGNRLTRFFAIGGDRLSLATLRLSDNLIEAIPDEISRLQALKVLQIKNNRLTALPRSLAECHKLKELILTENPITDRRLLKLINQCGVKQILDYVKAKSPPVKAAPNSPSAADPREASPKPQRARIRVLYSTEALAVALDPSTRPVREFFVGFLVRNVSFTAEGLRRFIQVQNRLHEGVCQRRTLATIATHDFGPAPPPRLSYTTRQPQILKIRPLNRAGEVTAARLISQLSGEANALRKEKKRSTYSGIHKYLYLVEGKASLACLVDDTTGICISFPPITNCDQTKISLETKTIFVEVTGSESLEVCKRAAEELIRESFEVLSNDNELVLEQVRTVDPEGALKVVFPAKNDLEFDMFDVVRD